ncbi:DUF2461 domain-containing protein [Verrucosispora sp. WMMA2121]|uniref:DUF2461 domain-containing protein n=1 Tax=Verrucosispora sp. WMMA2121 TaxID=3015164 RepID=UPI0022B646A9|nr:DUF2461 domain-containing protein [Verrucosispora sp. WMMA2121]MCZ7421218.1 DUF2461 domain-containing protein [Verrucosispora sp. WMMA2121]
MSRRQQGSADVKTFGGFPAEAFRFYQDLEKHNTRDHWHRHKDTYDSCVREPMEALAAELGDKYGAVKVWRPQRDVRFAKDKSPYKTYQGLTAGSADSVGYYLQLDAEGLRLGGGYHGLSAEQVERYREAVDDGRSGAALQRIVDDLTADDWDLIGERLKTRPRGCPADHPRVELLRYRSLAADRVHRVSDGIDGEAAVRLVRDGWDALGPLVDWLDRHVSTTGGS